MASNRPVPEAPFVPSQRSTETFGNGDYRTDGRDDADAEDGGGAGEVGALLDDPVTAAGAALRAEGVLGGIPLGVRGGGTRTATEGIEGGFGCGSVGRHGGALLSFLLAYRVS